MIFNTTIGEGRKLPVLNSAYPADVTLNAGTAASFQVSVAQDGVPAAYTYQWYVNGSAVAGAASPNYIRDTASDKGLYTLYCTVTNKAGTVTSRTAALTVRKTPVLSSSYPADASLSLGSSVTCKVTVSETGYPDAYTYQWYVGGSAVSGATASTYTYTPSAVGTSTVYCKVTNAAGTVASRTATVTATALELVSGSWSGSLSNLTTYYWDGGNYQEQVLYTLNKIDLTPYKQLTLNATASLYSGSIRVGPSASQGTDGLVSSTTGEFSAPSTGNLILDLSSVNGMYYLVIKVGANYSGDYDSFKCTINSIKLE